MPDSKASNALHESGYTRVHGLNMYYEIYGKGRPLVLLHGGGSTIDSSFGRVIPELAVNRLVIGIELQAHGRTSDRKTELSFEQDADDVAALLKNLGIRLADFFGFSNGGTTTLQIGIRHPEIVNKLLLGSALAKRNGAPASFWEFMKQARLENMPEALKEAYKKVAPDPEGLQRMHDKDVKRMLSFNDIPDIHLKSIYAPTLIIVGERDLVLQEHAREMQMLIPNSKLLVCPGGHGAYIGEITTLQHAYRKEESIVPVIEKFLDE